MPAPTIQTAAITTSPARDLSVRAILPWALLALLLSSGPYLLAWLATPKGQVFSGILANHNDFTAYIAAMRQGAAGQWLFHFNFSPNVWQPQLMLPAYILAGKVLGSFSNNNFLWFNVLRVAALIFTMGAFLVWVRRIFPGRVTTQRVAWLFLTLGGGLGWLLWPLTASWAVSTSYFPDLSLHAQSVGRSVPGLATWPGTVPGAASSVGLGCGVGNFGADCFENGRAPSSHFGRINASNQFSVNCNQPPSQI